MLYRLILALRHLFYDKGWKKSFQAPVPTVGIGNITVGGTGKTPHTELVLRHLLASDQWAYSELAVLSRGYKRRSRGFQKVPRDGSAQQFGDEPLQLARKFPQVTVAVDKDRVEGARLLTSPEELDGNKKARRCLHGDFPAAQLIVLDDAFQYRRLRCSLDIVLVDYNRPVHKDRLMPWGRLRDLPSRIKKAGIVIITKCPSFLDGWERSRWRQYLGLKPQQKLYFTTLSYGGMESVFPEADIRYTYSKRLVLFTGIANDAPLRSYLSDSYKIVERIAFPDHHRYTRADVARLEAAVKANPTACLVTTEKDAQRVEEAPGLSDSLRQRIFYLPVEAVFLTPEEKADFDKTLLEAL